MFEYTLTDFYQSNNRAALGKYKHVLIQVDPQPLLDIIGDITVDWSQVTYPTKIAKRNDHFHPSSIMDCERLVINRMNNVPGNSTIKSYGEASQKGEYLHEVVQGKLHRAGRLDHAEIYLSDYYYANRQELESLHLDGQIDGLLYFSQVQLFEAKFKNTNFFHPPFFYERYIPTFFDKVVEQTTTYMHFLNLTETVLLIGNFERFNDWQCFIIKYDDEVWQKIKETLNRRVDIIKNNLTPIGQPNQYCKNCMYRNGCNEYLELQAAKKLAKAGKHDS